MRDRSVPASAAHNVAIYPWFKFGQSLLFWQATWFLYFQSALSAAEAILLYAVYDVASTLIEVPSGYLSDRVGRRFTLIASSVAGAAGAFVLVLGDGFAAFTLGQALLGASAALWSGTDSALLYESLVAEGRADEVEAQELRAWRFSFTGFAVSAVLGGAFYLVSPSLPFLGAGFAWLATTVLSLRFAETPHREDSPPEGAEIRRIGQLRSAFRSPVLLWLFVLSTLMYGYSHLPFVFGQPFIQEALAGLGLEAETPLVSGAVSAVMMLVSVGTSALAPGLRRAIGLPAILLLAFGMQVTLVAVLAASNAAIVIGILFLRMVPDSLAKPFILARVQPELQDETRATYLSVKSLAGRLVFAASLWIAAGGASATGDMSFAEIRGILVWYAAAGLAALIAFAVAARRVPLEPGVRRPAAPPPE